MAAPNKRSILPRSLFGRALTILLVPIIVLQLVVGLVFFQRHYLRVSEQLTRSVAYELALAVKTVDAAPDPAAAAARITELGLPLALAVKLDPAPHAPTAGVRRDFFDLTGVEVAATLEEVIDRPVLLDLQNETRTARIAIGTTQGTLVATVPRDRLSVSNPHQLLVLMLLVSLILTAVAVIFLRNQVRPIRKLAEVAEAFGKGRSLPFRPAGAEEVRRAGMAFLSMRARLERQMEQRTQMLSGVSHDLRTPLTRMKLTLALMDESEETEDLAQDVGQMERMLAEFLAFARGDSLEVTEVVDVFALTDAIAEGMRRTGTAIDVVHKVDEGAEDEPVLFRPLAVERAIQNLVGNAARHGRRVRLSVRLSAKAVIFVVEDDGPGIPETDRQRALQPFARLDAARPSASDGGAGVGLGLTIALDVARSHGGTLELGESADLGGLRAVLRLPR